MLKLKTGLVRRLALAPVAILALAAAPQLAQAQTPGSLAELGCIQAPSSSTECASTGTGLNGTLDVAVSPDGQNVYVAGGNDDAISEFTRNTNGSLTQLAAPNDCIVDPSTDGSGSCAGAFASGLVGPESIVVSPDGNNVYVAAQDFNGNGTIAEFTRNADGSLTPISGHDCIAENINATDQTSPCNDQSGFGIQSSGGTGIVPALALAISPDGKNVYVADEQNEDIAIFNRAADGSLSQPDAANDCIADVTVQSTECGKTATGISNATGVAVTPDNGNVYTVGFQSSDENGTIAEFKRNADGSLTQPASPANCIEPQADDVGCGTTAIGVVGIAGLIVSPDGRNVYTASETFGGPIAEFSRDASGALTQLPAPNDCFQEGGNFGCSQTGIGIASGYRLAISPDGASVYAAAPNSNCNAGSCSDVAEFARNGDGSLTQLSSPDGCIQDANVSDTECPGNENGRGLGGRGLAISPDGASLYVAGGGNNDISAFTRTPPATLTVSLAGSGSGSVSDGTGSIACPTICSHAYAGNSQVTLTAMPAAGSTFAGWTGACSGTGPCQVTMNADRAVTATFAAAPGTPGQPGPVSTGRPSAVTDAGAGFSGSVNPEGLPTTVFFQYGLDKRYSQVGASGPNYTQRTASQSVGSDFAVHGVGPVAVSGLVPNALYHVRLVATNSAGTAFGQDVTFTTKLAPNPGAPTLGTSFNIAPVSGLVLILIHGHLVPLTQLKQIPLGVAIDSLHGSFELTTDAGAGGPAHDAAAKGKKRKTQSGSFGGAVVRIHQVKGGANRGLTTVMMVLSAFKGAPSQALCNVGKAGDAHAARARTLQLLHASAHGKFRTSGRYSAATVRGTEWTMAARCDGTLVRDISDSVAVTDFVRHKTVVLHAGQSYLAPSRRKH